MLFTANLTRETVRSARCTPITGVSRRLLFSLQRPRHFAASSWLKHEHVFIPKKDCQIFGHHLNNLGYTEPSLQSQRDALFLQHPKTSQSAPMLQNILIQCGNKTVIPYLRDERDGYK